MIMSSLNSSMEDLPGNVIADVLSRLPVKTIIHCKCVCKKWSELVSESYFINLHLSRSPAGVMIHHNCQREDFMYLRVEEPGILKWLEIKDDVDNTHLHHDLVTTFDLNLIPTFQNSKVLQVGSVNGLICLWQYAPVSYDNTYICNPITREYMILYKEKYYRRDVYATILYGFGVSLLTKEYKVIRIFPGDIPPNLSLYRPHLLEAEIYTLGIGRWRYLGPVPYSLKEFQGPFLNGCAHWIVLDPDSPEKLCAFDFDCETFKLFPSPPSVEIEGNILWQSLGVLNGCLSRCDSFGLEFTIWVMKEYGIKNSWHKEVVIKPSIRPDIDSLIGEPLTLLEGLKDGTIFMLFHEDGLLVYCPWKKTIEPRQFFKRYFTGMAYRPSFFKLHTFKSEIVHVL